MLPKSPRWLRENVHLEVPIEVASNSSPILSPPIERSAHISAYTMWCFFGWSTRRISTRKNYVRKLPLTRQIVVSENNYNQGEEPIKARETLDPALMVVEPLGKALSASLKRSTGATQHSHVPLDHHSRKACNRPRACTAVPVAAWRPIFRIIHSGVEMWS